MGILENIVDMTTESVAESSLLGLSRGKMS